MAAHTIPPYPALEARLGAEGTVVLRVVIGSDGAVMAAQVVRTAGMTGWTGRRRLGFWPIGVTNRPSGEELLWIVLPMSRLGSI